MKKRYLVLLLFFVYVTLLFVLAGQFETRDSNLISKGFAINLGEGLSLFFRYIAISFLSSSAFWCNHLCYRSGSGTCSLQGVRSTKETDTDFWRWKPFQRWNRSCSLSGYLWHHADRNHELWNDCDWCLTICLYDHMRNSIGCFVRILICSHNQKNQEQRTGRNHAYNAPRSFHFPYSRYH